MSALKRAKSMDVQVPSRQVRKTAFARGPKTPISSASRSPSYNSSRNSSYKSLASASTTDASYDAPETQRRGSNPTGMRNMFSRDQAVKAPPPKFDPAKYDGLDDEFEAFLFIKQIPAVPERFRRRKKCIPPKRKDAPAQTLVLDLDETLVHCGLDKLSNPDQTFEVDLQGVNYKVFAKYRPHLSEFLATVSEWFEIVIFTASQQVYADQLLDLIDPGKQWIEHRVFRDSCVQMEGNYIKDLDILGRDLSTTFIVDNSTQAFAFQINNGIPIKSWFEDPGDEELLKLIPVLENLKDQADCRPHLEKRFGLHKLIDAIPEYLCYQCPYFNKYLHPPKDVQIQLAKLARAKH